MTLPQHLEPYMSPDNTQLSRAFREAVFPGSSGKTEGESPADFLLGCIARYRRTISIFSLVMAFLNAHVMFVVQVDLFQLPVLHPEGSLPDPQLGQAAVS